MIFKGNVKKARIAVLACLVLPMFGSYFFDDIFSTISHLFNNPESLELGWDAADYGFYAGGYSTLCIFGGLIAGGILLDLFGVRLIGSIFLGAMVTGAAIVVVALTGGLSPKMSLAIAYTGRMLFGLGSEIAGVAVTRSIAKWFKNGNMSLAMGIQLAVARLGTAAALIISPILVVTKPLGQTYSLMETAYPAIIGLVIMAVGAVFWRVFSRLDKAYDERMDLSAATGKISRENEFRFSDIGSLFTNKRFAYIAMLCVFFYCSVVSFKKFGSAILVPRFDMDPATAGRMISMIPFSTVLFTPLFGIMVDKYGKAERWMLAGSVMVCAAHIIIAVSPEGMAAFGYIALGLLGIGFSLVPSAMWPSVSRIVSERSLGTAYSLIYWIQNMGLMATPMIVGVILRSGSPSASIHAEYVFIALGSAAIITSLLINRVKIKLS